MALSYKDVAAKQTQLNWAQPHHFYLVIERLPELVYTCQRCTISDVSAGEASLPNRFNTNIFVPGESLEYGTLAVDIILTNNFSNYRSILEWMKGNQNSETYDQSVNYLNSVDKYNAEKHKSFRDHFSDMTVIATDGADRPLCQWNFKHAFPISLGGPSFDASVQDTAFMKSDVQFQFHYFEHQTYTDGALDNNLI